MHEIVKTFVSVVTVLLSTRLRYLYDKVAKNYSRAANFSADFCDQFFSLIHK